MVICTAVQAVPGSRGLLSSLLTGTQETNSTCHAATCSPAHAAEHTSFVDFFPDASFTNGHEQFLPDISQDQVTQGHDHLSQFDDAAFTRSLLNKKRHLPTVTGFNAKKS